MTRAQFNSETSYLLAMSVANAMLRQGLITKAEYAKISTKALEKWEPILSGLTQEK